MVDSSLPRSVSLHWDIENVAVPCGASTIQVVNRIRDAVIAEMGEIQAFYAYLDVAKASRQLRQELAMAGLDLIDCSSASGKPGQVDLRIIARALRTSPSEGVVIVSGDSDFAYVISQLRSARRRTALVYDANNTASVSTALLEVANVTLAVPLSGEPEAASPTVAEASTSAAAELTVDGTPSEGAASDGASSSVVLPATALKPVQPAAVVAGPSPDFARRQLLDAIARSPEAESGGWRTGPTVGELFRRLSNGDNNAFRAAKKALVESGHVQRHPSGRDLIRVTQ